MRNVIDAGFVLSLLLGATVIGGAVWGRVEIARRNRAQNQRDPL